MSDDQRVLMEVPAPGLRESIVTKCCGHFASGKLAGPLHLVTYYLLFAMFALVVALGNCIRWGVRLGRHDGSARQYLCQQLAKRRARVHHTGNPRKNAVSANNNNSDRVNMARAPIPLPASEPATGIGSAQRVPDE